VTDFGIAKAMTQSHETQTGVLKGKYAYMSPEQAVGAALDARSDLFSCGIVLYEMLFDRRLFAGASDIETLDRVRRAEVFWPEDLSTALHPGIIEALKKALARRPQDRFASAEEFAEALEACVPAAERFSQRKFCRFLSEVFSAEIQKRRQVREEKQENFSRQTRIVPGREGTVSLRPLAATEVEARPHPMTEARAEAPKVSRRLWLYPLVAAALIVPFYWFSAQRKVPSQAWTALPPLFSEAFSAAAALRPLLPATQPVEKAPAVLPKNDLRLAVLPAQGHLSAVFPGGKREGVGELWLRDLPVGTEVRVSASLANYEPVQRSFTVAEQASPQESLIQLEKKAPAYGSIRVNAVPWGKVSIPGYVSGGETPLVRGRIPEGKYSVSVSHPPLHK
ncbi:MAG TPA: hypothetical protein DF383_09555, partial [Deltaproteobacteria bacterium]|nr:hypothetical protein [Deltaproteobacteria bacterium]